MVAVIDRHKKPLIPCTERRARILLEKGRARVHRIYPVFIIRLVDRLAENSVVHSVRMGIDPGSKTTGIALSSGKRVLFLANLEHRGEKIHLVLERRKMFRRARRNRKTRYRETRFDYRTRPKGWLPPSVRHKVESTVNLAKKLQRYFNIAEINVETAKFDTQKMQDPEISGVEYQRGVLQGWDVREYLLDKFDRTCVYCGKKNVPFEIDHVLCKSKGGSDRVSNLVIACHECNQAKDNLSLEEFCPEKVEVIWKQLKTSLKDAAVMNAIRFRIADELKTLGIPVTISFGSQTKFNRRMFEIPKEHCLDALFSGETVAYEGWNMPFVKIACMGRGTRSRTLLDRFGFPRAYLPRKKMFFGFQTGDIVKAVVKTGKKAGTYVGRIAVRSSGSFDIKTADGLIQGLGHRWFRFVQRNDGHMYSLCHIINQSRDSFRQYPTSQFLPRLKAGVSLQEGV